jgi:hypothetical protein
VATKCFTVVRGKRLRVTRLDECGNPPGSGEAGSLVVTKGFISVGLTSEVESGDDITQKNADGELCVSDRSQDQFKNWSVAGELCEVDPALLSLVSNVTLEEDWNGDVVGVRGYQGAPTGRFALEVWTGVPGSDCVPGEATNFGYLLLPFVVPGVLGDITIENGAATFSFSGFTRGAGGWGVGPYDVVPTNVDNDPGPLAVPMTNAEHHLMRLTTVAPPEVDCGLQAMVAYAHNLDGTPGE